MEDEKAGVVTHFDLITTHNSGVVGEKNPSIDTIPRPAFTDAPQSHILSPPLPIPPRSLRARIKQNNHASLALFSSLGFVAVRLVEVFGEVEMRWVGIGLEIQSHLMS